MGRVGCYEPIHGGPLDGGERYGDRPFPWRPDIRLIWFAHEGHWYEFDRERRAFVYQGKMQQGEERDDG